jgi:hypothetical protein
MIEEEGFNRPRFTTQEWDEYSARLKDNKVDISTDTRTPRERLAELLPATE